MLADMVGVTWVRVQRFPSAASLDVSNRSQTDRKKAVQRLGEVAEEPP